MIIANNVNIRINHCSTQKRLAYALHEHCGVPIRRCGLDEVKQFQTQLTDYQINLVSKEDKNSIIYSGPENEKCIYLFSHDNHYDVITSMPAFSARKKYCHKCKKGYDKSIDHLCPDSWEFKGDHTRNEFCEWLFTKEHAKCILPMRLADFPKTFGLNELAKGFFLICLTGKRIKTMLDLYLRLHFIIRVEWVLRKKKSFWSGIKN